MLSEYARVSCCFEGCRKYGEFLLSYGEAVPGKKKGLAGMNYWQYRERHDQFLPLLFLLIDDYGSFRELTGDKFQELVEKIAREGNSCGIYLILTAAGAGKEKYREGCRISVRRHAAWR